MVRVSGFQRGRWLCMIMAAAFFVSCQALVAKTVLIYDTGVHPVERYDTSFQMMRQLDWKLKYMAMDVILDQGNDAVFSQAYDIVIFLVDVEVVRALRTSYAREVVLDAMRRVGKFKNTLTMLMLPSLGNRELQALTNASPFFDALGLDLYKKKNREGEDEPGGLAKMIMRFIANPFEARHGGYHSALSMPRTHTPTILRDLSKTLSQRDGRFFAALPTVHDDLDARLGSLLPFGVYFYHPLKERHLMISFASLFSTFDTDESFQFFPLDEALQENFKHLYFGFFRELDHLLVTKPSLLNESIRKTLLDKNAGAAAFRQPDITFDKKGTFKTAWLELDVFDDGAVTEYKAKQKVQERQKQLAEYAVKSGLDYVWVSLSPQMYFGAWAKRANKKEVAVSSLDRFMKLMGEVADVEQRKPPQILLGFEIANNIYDPHVLPMPAMDMYDQEYPDMPSPVDEDFWEREVCQPLRDFLAAWKNYGSNNDPYAYGIMKKERELGEDYGVKIAGVVLDLELYGRKKTGLFYSTMGFNEDVVEDFVAEKDLELDDDMNPVQWLAGKKKTHAYFAYLEARVKKIGQQLKDCFEAELPGAVIGCYTPAMIQDWFYRSLLASLSSPDKPIHWFSFSSDMRRVAPVIKKHGIHAYHSSVLMISKIIDNSESFAWVQKIAERNHGVWFNRFSRFVEDSDPSAWHAVEQPGIVSAADKLMFFAYLRDYGVRPPSASLETVEY